MEKELYRGIQPVKVPDTTSLWFEFEHIANKYDCVNLGIGTPYMSPPEELVKNMHAAIAEGYN